MKKPWISRGWRILVLSFLSILANFVYSSDTPDGTIAQEPAVLSNTWVHAEINARHGGGLNRLTVHQEEFLHTVSKGDQFPAPGASLLLYTDHPLSSTDTVALPSETVAECTQGEAEIRWRIQTEKPSPMEMVREYRMSNRESAFCVTTTITNKSESAIAFYPTERVKFNASIGNDRIPNMFAYFYSPCSPDQSNKEGYEVVRGGAEKKQYSRMTNEPIFIARYMMKTGEVKLTNEMGWFAFQNLIGRAQIQGGTVCAVEYGFPSGKPKPVRDNLILFVSGAGDPKENQNALDPFMQVSYVLGKVELKPGESFVYTANWTAVCCQGPIIEVRNGVAYNKRMETLVVPKEGAFVNFTNMGIPQEGVLGFRFYDKDGNVRMQVDSEGNKFPHILVGSISTKERAKEIDPFLPTNVSLLIGAFFSPEDLRDKNDSFDQLIKDQIHTVKMYLLDNPRNRIIQRELGAFSAPFPVYDKPID